MSGLHVPPNSSVSEELICKRKQDTPLKEQFVRLKYDAQQAKSARIKTPLSRDLSRICHSD